MISPILDSNLPDNPLIIEGHTFDCFHIIPNIDQMAGFSALISVALTEIQKSIENNWLPVIYFDPAKTSNFYSESHGDNVWEYFFEPVMKIGYAELSKQVESGNIAESQIHRYSDEDFHKLRVNFLTNPKRVTTIWNGTKVEDPALWMARNRAQGRRFVARYVKPRPHILRKVKKFVAENISPQYTLGVHIRGTDFAYASPTKPEQYIVAIHQHAKERNLEDFRIFLATDQVQFVDLFISEFGDRIITYESMRSGSDVPVFLWDNADAYRKGEDVLIDILLLSRCNFLIKSTAAVGEYALWFNPSLECIDFAPESTLKPTYYMTAYLKLNIGNLSPLRRFLLVATSNARHFKLFFLDLLMKLGRIVLPTSLRNWLWKKVGTKLVFSKSSTDWGSKLPVKYHGVKGKASGNEPV